MRTQMIRISLDVGPADGLAIDIDEQRAGQRLIRPILDRFSGWQYRTAPAVHGDEFELITVGFVVRKWNVPEGVLVTGHALYQCIVILTGRVITSARFRLA